MLIVRSNLDPTLNRLSLILTPDVARDLVEKVTYLLENPAYHHDHLEWENQILDLVVMDPINKGSYSEEIERALREHGLD